MHYNTVSRQTRENEASSARQALPHYCSRAFILPAPHRARARFEKVAHERIDVVWRVVVFANHFFKDAISVLQRLVFDFLHERIELRKPCGIRAFRIRKYAGLICPKMIPNELYFSLSEKYNSSIFLKISL